MGVSFGRARILETIFNLREHRGGPDGMRPSFARHGRHVAAVLAAGGYPTLKR